MNKTNALLNEEETPGEPTHPPAVGPCPGAGASGTIPQGVPDPGTLGALIRTRWVPLLAILALYTGLFWQIIRQWFEDCREMEDFSHCLLIPPICLLVIYWNRRRLRSLEITGGMPGFLLLLASLPVYFVGLAHSYNVFQRAGLYGATIGICGCLFGTRFIRDQIFPLAYLSLAIPMPFEVYQGLALKLRKIATGLSASALQLIGVPALDDGNILRFGEQALDVVDACSGIRSFMAIISVAVLFCYLLDTGWIGSVLLLAISVPIIILCSVARLFFQAALLHYWSIDLTREPHHSILGMAAFVFSLLLLYASWIFFRWVLQLEPRPDNKKLGGPCGQSL